MGPEKNYLKKGSRHPTGKRHNSLQVSTKHSCNHHHHQRLFPPLINGRLAVVYSYGSEVGTFLASLHFMLFLCMESSLVSQ